MMVEVTLKLVKQNTRILGFWWHDEATILALTCLLRLLFHEKERNFYLI